MNLKETTEGLIFHALGSQEKGLSHSLLNRMLGTEPLAQELLARLQDGGYEVFYVRHGETSEFLDLLERAKTDLEEEIPSGDHDEKIGSCMEAEHLIVLIETLKQLCQN